MESGIYQIKNSINNNIYIGSSVNIRTRFKTHLNLLKKNKHENLKLQNAVNKYGLENFEFIKLIGVILNKIVEYNFKSDANKNNLHGLIAQDLYEVYPEAVTKGNDDTPWSIDYSKLVPVLLKSIQELSERVEELEKK